MTQKVKKALIMQCAMLLGSYFHVIVIIILLISGSFEHTLLNG